MLANRKEAKTEPEDLGLGLVLEFSSLLIWRGAQVWAVGDCPLLAAKPGELVPQTQGP